MWSAGLNGQPAPKPDVVRAIQSASRDLSAGSIATARPALLLTVQQNPTADLTDLLGRVLGDDTTFLGLTDTLEEAASKATNDTDRAFIQYNLAKLYLLRARLLPEGTLRRGPLEAAAKVTDQFPADLRDPAVGELKGDIALEGGDANGAVAAYQKTIAAGGASAQAQYRIGLAYERTNHLPQAQRALEQAQRALTAGGDDTVDSALRYNVTQELAQVLTLQNNDNAALVALSQSVRIRHDDSGASAFRYRTDVARRLLQRGHAREVATYAEAALRVTPDDTDLQALRADAAGRLR